MDSNRHKQARVHVHDEHRKIAESIPQKNQLNSLRLRTFGVRISDPCMKVPIFEYLQETSNLNNFSK